MVKICWIDVETTGLMPWVHDVIQIALIVDIDSEVREALSFHVKPLNPAKAEQKALDVNGLTMDQIMQFPDAKETLDDEIVPLLDRYVKKYDKEDKFTFAAYNAGFDKPFVSKWFKNLGHNYFHSYFDYHPLDPMIMAAALKHAGIINPPDLKLVTVAGALGVELNNAHEAMADITATRNIWYKQLELIKPTGGINAVSPDSNRQHPGSSPY